MNMKRIVLTVVALVLGVMAFSIIPASNAVAAKVNAKHCKKAKNKTKKASKALKGSKKKRGRAQSKAAKKQSAAESASDRYNQIKSDISYFEYQMKNNKPATHLDFVRFRRYLRRLRGDLGPAYRRSIRAGKARDRANRQVSKTDGIPTKREKSHQTALRNQSRACNRS